MTPLFEIFLPVSVRYKALLVAVQGSRTIANWILFKRAKMAVLRRLLLKNISDSHHSSTLTAWSASVGGEKSESAPSRFTGKDRRPRYPSLNSPDAGTRVHYDRAFVDQHFTVRIYANLPLHGILLPSLGPTHQRYAYCLKHQYPR